MKNLYTSAPAAHNPSPAVGVSSHLNKNQSFMKKILLPALTVGMLLLFNLNGWAQSNGDYRSNAATMNWNTTTNGQWQIYNNGWVNTSTPPTSANGTITIRNGHTVTVTANVTVDQVVVESGGNLTVGAATLTIANGTGTDLNVNGTLATTTSTSAAFTINTGATIAVNAGATYIHARNGGTIPTATWDQNSTCSITGATSTSPGGYNQTFGNFTWNCNQSTGNYLTLAATSMSIAGDLTIAATGASPLGFAIEQNITIGGDLIITGGIYRLAYSANRTQTVQGNVSITGGTLLMSSNNTVGTLNVAGNFSHTAGTINENSTGSGTIVFNGTYNGTTGMQTYTSGGTVSNTINFTVNSNAYLQMGTGASPSTITGGGTFTLSNGATLGITSTAGITTTGATGNIQVTGTRTYTTGADYIYNGTAAQVTGNGLTQNTPADVTINNSAGVTLSAATTISGLLTMTSGTLTMNNLALTVGSLTGTSNIALGSAALTVGSDNTSPAAYSGLISGTGTVTKNGTGTLILSGANTYTGTTTINAGTLTLGAANALPITASAGTIQFAGGTPIFNLGLFNLGSGTGGATSAGQLDFDVNTTVNLGASGTNTYYFKASNGQTWNATAITIYNWTGTGGNSGTGPRIYVGSDATGLTSTQLSKITFNGYTGSPILLATGELVPPVPPTITTGTITGSPFCAGTGVTVPFTSTGTYTSNTYTAQLSNSSGSFASPTAIGTLVSNANSGNISATIPGGATTGTGYRIRVVSSSPAVTGTDNGVNLTINAAPAAPTGSASQSFCATDNPTVANLSATGSNIQWYSASSGGSPLPGSTALVNNTHYYASQTVSGCESVSRLDVTVTLTASGTWLGTTSTDWATPSNWCGGVPTSSTAVTIPSGGNQPIISSSTTAECSSIAIAGSLTNNGTLTISGALSGAGSLTNASTGTLNIGGNATITTLTATATGNEVNYTGAAQTVKGTTYYNLTLSGSGAKTTTSVSVNNILSLEGTATVSATPTYGSSSTLQFNKPAAYTAGTEWVAAGPGSGGVVIKNTGAITASTTGTTYTVAKLTVESGATLNMNRPMTNNGITDILGSINFGSTTIRAYTLTGDVTLYSGSSWVATAAAHTYAIAGNFTNDATTFTASSGTHTFSGTGKTIDGATTTSIPYVAITGTRTNNATLTVTAGLSGAGTLTNAATLNIGGTCSVTTLSNSGDLNVTGSGNITTTLANFTNTGTIDLNGSGAITGITNNANGIVNLSNSGTITSFNNATASSLLNISDLTVPTITTLTATATGNTVNYSGAGAQTLKVTTYYNLILSGSGAKTIGTAAGGTLATGNLSIAPTGTATASVTNTNVGVGTLSIGGTGTVNGTWGSTSSAASYKNNTYFTSGVTGYLNVSNSSCASSPNPPASNGDQSICSSQSIPALTVTVGSGETADWYSAATGGTLLLSGNTSYTPSGAGTFYAEARNTTSNCISVTRTGVTLTITTAATANAGPDGNATIGVPYTVSGANASNYTSILWTKDGGTGTFTGTNTLTPTYTPVTGDPATITFTLTANGNSPCGAVSDDMTLTIASAPASSSWSLTATSSNWFDPANWGGIVPGATTNITIPGGAANYPTLTSPATCANITIQDGGSFIGTEYLTVTGISLAQRSVPANTYHFLSSPVVSTTFNSVFPNNQLLIWAQVYNEPTGTWINQTISNSMVPGIGYSVWIDPSIGAQTALFSGTFNSTGETETLSLLNGGGNPNLVGWNLLGNPFPSGIDWDNGGWHGGNVDGSVYIWDGAGQIYKSWNGSIGSMTGGVIPPENGFFVKTNTNNSTITIPLAARVHTGQGFYKDAVPNTLQVGITGNGYHDDTYIQFTPDATAGFDVTGDAYKLWGITDVPQVYSIIPGDVLSINALPSTEANPVVSLGLKVGAATTYTLTASGMASFDPFVPVRLDDLKLGTTQDLRLNDTYTFTAAPGDPENRFNIRFYSPVGTEEPAMANFLVWADHRDIIVNNAGGYNGLIHVYNTAGQLIKTLKMEPGIHNIMSLPVGVYIVKASSGKAVVSRKVVLF